MEERESKEKAAQSRIHKEMSTLFSSENAADVVQLVERLHGR